MRRTIWFDMVQIDKRKKSLTSTVVKIQKARSRMCDFYLPMIDENVPDQLAGKLILHSGSNAGFIQVLHRYLFSTTQPMPDRLRQLLIEAGVANLENSIQFETTPELSRFWWYRGALNQYHAALLLMAEVYAYPMRKEAGRIWKCLDYIFEIPAHLSPKQKAELVLTDLRDRMEIYHQMRKVKNTAAMEAQVHQLMRAWERDDSTSPPSLPPLTEAPSELRGQYPVESQPIDAMLPPTGWSTPMTTQTSDTSGSGSHPGSVGAPSGADTQMSAMEDIDWVRLISAGPPFPCRLLTCSTPGRMEQILPRRAQHRRSQHPGLQPCRLHRQLERPAAAAQHACCYLRWRARRGECFFCRGLCGRHVHADVLSEPY